MPIYEFRCRRCGHEFEKLLGAASAPVTCPSCSARKVEKKFSVFGARSGGKFTASTGGGCSGCAKSSCASCR